MLVVLPGSSGGSSSRGGGGDGGGCCGGGRLLLMSIWVKAEQAAAPFVPRSASEKRAKRGTSTAGLSAFECYTDTLFWT